MKHTPWGPVFLITRGERLGRESSVIWDGRMTPRIDPCAAVAVLGRCPTPANLGFAPENRNRLAFAV